MIQYLLYEYLWSVSERLGNKCSHASHLVSFFSCAVPIFITNSMFKTSNSQQKTFHRIGPPTQAQDFFFLDKRLWVVRSSGKFQAEKTGKGNWVLIARKLIGKLINLIFQIRSNSVRTFSDFWCRPMMRSLKIFIMLSNLVYLCTVLIEVILPPGLQVLIVVIEYSCFSGCLDNDQGRLNNPLLLTPLPRLNFIAPITFKSFHSAQYIRTSKST